MIIPRPAGRAIANPRQRVRYPHVTMVGVLLRLARFLWRLCAAASQLQCHNSWQRVRSGKRGRSRRNKIPFYAPLCGCAYSDQGDSQVWMVEDGKTLYVGQNANADLKRTTDPIRQSRHERQRMDA